MKVIGIIGPPCSGKSTIAKQIVTNDGVWIDADQIAKDQLLVPEVIELVVAALGDTVRRKDGSLDRAIIANLVFGLDAESKEKLTELEAIIHPRTAKVIDRLLERARMNGTHFVALDIPLLIENGWQEHCDEIWCVQVPTEQHKMLLHARGWTLEELERRTRSQLAWDEKRSKSDWLIVNDSTLENLRTCVDERLKKLR